MRIFDVPISELERIAASIGVEFKGNETITKREKLHRVQGALKPKAGSPNPYQRTSASYFNQERKVAAVCWHGYRDFMRQVFNEFPNARIVTGLYGKADYKGQASFENNYRETGLTPIGAPIAGGYPRLCEACECPESGYNQ